MADENVKSTLDMVKQLGQALNYTREEQNKLNDAAKRYDETRGQVQQLKSDVDKFHTSLTPIKDEIEKIRSSSGGLAATFGGALASLYNISNSALDAAQQFNSAWDKTNFGKTISGIDEATALSREFRREAINIGSAFGESFSDVQKDYQGYEGAVMLAQNATYESRAAIEAQTRALAINGIGLSDLSKTFDVAGTRQNMLTEGFRLASDSGLSTNRVFEMMATASRKMGLSIEDSSRPLLAIESMAKSTGLPISDLAGRIFNLTEDNARFGTSVESLSPIVRRFTNVLGDGFKGFAIKDTERLIQGLASQVNQANSAFIAMQSGQARPGGGVASAMVDYEDAMAKPEEAMKMLASSLSNIGGGKILTFQDAHASEQAAIQFKLQRDMLAQLTGINDPQQTRTLMALLSEQQSGKQLSAQENKTLEDAMKSGASKQDESKSLAEKMGKAQVVLLADIALHISNIAQRAMPAQASSALINTASSFINKYKSGAEDDMANKVGGYLEDASRYFSNLTQTASGEKNALGNIGDWVGKTMSEGKANNIQTSQSRVPGAYVGQNGLMVGGPSLMLNGAEVPAPSSPTPQFTSNTSQDQEQSRQEATKSGEQAPGQSNVVTIILKGSDDITRALAGAATVMMDKIHRGHA